MSNELELITEAGKLSIPKQSIDYLVSRLHVGTSDEDLTKTLTDRIEKSKVAWPNAAIKQATAYAIQSHRKNQDMYSQVISGNLGQPRKPKKEKEEPVTEGVLDDQPNNDYYNLIQATIGARPTDFKEAFNKIIGPKIVDTVLAIKDQLKREMYAETEAVVETVVPVNSKAKSILEAKKNVK